MQNTTFCDVWHEAKKNRKQTLESVQYELETALRESTFNMTRGGDADIEVGGLQKFLDTRKGGSEKIVGLEGRLRKSVYFKTNRRGGS